MIVRDEEECLPRCLGSVREIVDEIIIVDTGSRDRTPEIAREFGAKVVSAPWTGSFSSARNTGLDLASGDWILILDADNEVHPGHGNRIRPLLEINEVEGYFFHNVNLIGTGAFREETVCFVLFRNRPEYRYERGIHEQVAEVILRTNPKARLEYADITLLHYGYLDAQVTAKDKRRRNLEILQAEALQHPDDPYTRFNLGVECFRLGQYRKAATEFRFALRRTDPAMIWASRLIRLYVLTLMKLRQFKPALKWVEEAVRIHPAYTDLVLLQGLIYGEMGRTSEAIGSFYRCLAMGPAPAPPYVSDPGAGSFRAHFGLGQIYEAKGDLVAAADQYGQAFRANPAYLASLHRLARIWSHGEPADTVARRLAGYFDTGQASHQVALADVLFSGGIYGESLSWARKAEEAGAADPDGALTLLKGLSLLKTGDPVAAQDELRRINPESPYFPAARAGLHCSAWLAGGDPLLPGKGQPAIAATVDTAYLLRGLAEDILREGLRRFPQADILRSALLQFRPGWPRAGESGEKP
jgi:glycosyltransferase involved in cell wall biosynthesis